MSSPRRPSSPQSTRSANLSAHQHAPQTPSGLRESQNLSGSSDNLQGSVADVASNIPSPQPSPRRYPTQHNDPAADDNAAGSTRTNFLGNLATETTSLLRKPYEIVTGHVHPGPCNHGTFSPRLESSANSVRSGGSGHDFGGSARPGEGTGPEGSRSIFGTLLENIGVKNGNVAGKKRMSTTNWLAEQHGITNTTSMYVSVNYNGLVLLPAPLLMCSAIAGTLPTISLSSPGSSSINGRICKAIS